MRTNLSASAQPIPFPHRGLAPIIIHDRVIDTVPGPMLQTRRLRLRRWHERDIAPFLAMNRDTEVMQYFSARMSDADAIRAIVQYESNFDTRGYGIWAVEHRETGEFVGSVGLEPYESGADEQSVAICWKLCRKFWGGNYGYEAASAVVDFAFDYLRVPELIAIVPPHNARSQRLMRRLGLSTDAQPLAA